MNQRRLRLTPMCSRCIPQRSVPPFEQAIASSSDAPIDSPPTIKAGQRRTTASARCVTNPGQQQHFSPSSHAALTPRSFAAGGAHPPSCSYSNGVWQVASLGCTSPVAINYQSQATGDDGSCIVLGASIIAASVLHRPTPSHLPSLSSQPSSFPAGCMSSTAFNYDSTATIQGVLCIAT